MGEVDRCAGGLARGLRRQGVQREPRWRLDAGEVGSGVRCSVRGLVGRRHIEVLPVLPSRSSA